MSTQQFYRFEYPLIDENNNIYFGSYTIKSNVEPLHFKGEKLVEVFSASILEEVISDEI